MKYIAPIMLSLLMVAGVNAQESVPPPGEVYRVGGHEMHLNCTGEGDTTVILEAGVGGYSLNWFVAQPMIAEFTRVCSYDRLGYGWSSNLIGEFDLEAAAQNLHRLLSAAEVAPPYVLVAHSFGGPVSRSFQQQYPDDVTGLVLLDTVHPQMAEDISFYRPALVAQLDSLRAFATMMRFRSVFTDDPLFDPPEEIPSYISDAYNEQMLRREFFDTSEAEALYITDGLPDANLPTSVGNIPVIVVTHDIARVDGFLGAPLTREQARQAEAIWQTLQRDLATLSPQGRLVVAEGSSHAIQFDDPELIAALVKEVIESS